MILKYFSPSLSGAGWGARGVGGFSPVSHCPGSAGQAWPRCAVALDGLQSLRAAQGLDNAPVICLRSGGRPGQGSWHRLARACRGARLLWWSLNSGWYPTGLPGAGPDAPDSCRRQLLQDRSGTEGVRIERSCCWVAGAGQTSAPVGSRSPGQAGLTPAPRCTRLPVRRRLKCCR